MTSGLGWHLGFKIDQLSRLQSGEDVRKKIFLQPILGDLILTTTFHLNPFVSCCLQRPEIPFESAHCLGVRTSYLIWQLRWNALWTKKCVCHFCQGGWKRATLREKCCNKKHSTAEACVLTPNQASGDFNEKSQQEDKWVCSMINYAMQLSSITWLHPKVFLAPPGLHDGW